MSSNWTDSVLSEVQSFGIGIDHLIVDGEFHRVGPKKSQWYIVHHKIGDDGRVYYAASFGDWRSGETKTKTSNLGRKLTPDQKDAQRKIIDGLKAEIETKRIQSQIDAGSEAESDFLSCVASGATQYMKRKGIDQLYGARIRPSDHALVIPMRDNAGQVIGSQSIFDDGGKYFWPGQKTSGGLHFVGDASPGFCYVTEGFATAVSIHRATGKQVAVAFSAHNLMAVAEFVKSIVPKVVVCADNDQFTTGNPGVKAAREVQTKLGLEFVKPEFKDLSGNPTDFNDLEKMEGIEAVQSQIYANSRIEMQPVRVGLFDMPEEMGDDPGKQSEIADILSGATQGRLFYDPEFNKWWGFDGMWQRLTESRVENMVADAMNLIFPSGYSWGQMTAVVSFIRMRLSRPTPTPSRDLVPFQNGYIDIRTKEFKPHSVDVFLDWHIPCDRTDAIDTPACDEVLHNLAGQDSETKEYKDRHEVLLCFLAATLRGISHLHKFLELIGEPGSGKSTYMHLATFLVGKENTKNSSLSTLDKSSWETGTYYRKRLVVFADESDWGGSGDKLKSLTGGDALRNEEKYGRISSDFVFDGMVIVSANNYIRFADKSHALVRRRIPIKVERAIDEGSQDRRILDRLRGEVPALINCLLNIDVERIENTLSKAGGRYEDESRNSYIESNIVAAWMNDCCEPCDGHFSPTISEKLHSNPNGLYTNFQVWCETEGQKNIPTSHSFSRMMRSASKVLGWKIDKYQEGNGSRRKGWTGLRVKNSIKV